MKKQHEELHELLKSVDEDSHWNDKHREKLKRKILHDVEKKSIFHFYKGKTPLKYYISTVAAAFILFILLVPIIQEGANVENSSNYTSSSNLNQMEMIVSKDLTVYWLLFLLIIGALIGVILFKNRQWIMEVYRMKKVNGKIILTLLLLVSLLVNAFTHYKNHHYEVYLSEELNTHLATLIISSFKSEALLKNIVESKQISSENAEELQNSFKNISSSYQLILYMGERTNKLNGSISHIPSVTFSGELAYYVNAFINAEDNVQTLSADEYAFFYRLNAMMGELVELMEENVDGVSPQGISQNDYWSNPAYKKSINKKHWILILEKIDGFTWY